MAEDIKVVIFHVHAADLDGAGLGVVQARNELDQAGFRAACAADDAQRFAGFEGERDIIQHRLAGAVLILKGNMLKLNGAVGHLLHGVLGRGQVSLLVQHFHDTLGGRGGHGDHDERHAQHHQSHENVHDVAEQGVELAGGDGAVQDILGAEPAQGDVAAVNGGEHGGVIEAQAALRVDELVVQALAGLGVLLVFKALADKALDHADGRNVLLHGGVQVIVVFEHAVKNFERGHHDGSQHHQKEYHGHHKDQGQRAADHAGHEQGEHQMHRGAHAHPLDHLERVLHVGHVGGHTGDKAGGGVFVDVGERVMLDALIHGVAQIACKARGSIGGKAARQHTQQQRESGHQEREQAIFEDGVHIALLDALIDDERHDGGKQDIHDRFQRGKERRHDGRAFVLAQM